MCLVENAITSGYTISVGPVESASISGKIYENNTKVDYHFSIFTTTQLDHHLTIMQALQNQVCICTRYCTAIMDTMSHFRFNHGIANIRLV